MVLRVLLVLAAAAGPPRAARRPRCRHRAGAPQARGPGVARAWRPHARDTHLAELMQQIGVAIEVQYGEDGS